MPRTVSHALVRNFLGDSPTWYKAVILAFLVLNIILFHTLGPVPAGWALVAEFIFTLALALKCHPLPPGGLLALEAAILGLTSPETIYAEVVANFPVILLLMFMVAGIFFMKDLLSFVFTRILLRVRSKTMLSLLFCAVAAVLSAFLDALTVTAVIISVALGFYNLYHRYVSENPCDADNACPDHAIIDRETSLREFRGFLRSLMMHAAVGTALGGVATIVGEPQNLLIGHVMSWDFLTFFHEVSPISMPVLAAGLLTCVILERTRTFGYGHKLPPDVREVLAAQASRDDEARTAKTRAALAVQAIGGVLLVLGLALHLAEVGLIGLGVIILLTAFCGVTDEHRIADSFKEAMPFTALLVVFFAVVAVIHDQHLFAPIINHVLSMTGKTRLAAFYLANGLLSAVSDNVFVATVYISEAAKAFQAGVIDRPQFDALAVAINTGTNIPSVATPNGQAAFLFLLTSTLAPLIRLSYGRMVLMALPYTVVLSGVGLAALLLSH